MSHDLCRNLARKFLFNTAFAVYLSQLFQLGFWRFLEYLAFRFGVAAAAPTIRLAVETMPSFDPSTAARSQLTRCTK
jgi:hypothetical protein